MFEHGDHVEFRDVGDTWIAGVVLGVYRNTVSILVGSQIYEREQGDVRHV